jgi:hypothetical protein
VTEVDDPGWPIVGALTLRYRWGTRDSVLANTRMLYLFVVFLILVCVVGFAVVDADAEGSATWALSSVIVVALAGEVVRRRFEKPLNGSGPDALVDSWRSRFFLRFACANAIWVAAFIGFQISGAYWVFVAGAALALSSMFRFAPTTPSIRRERADLYELLVRTPAFGG